MIIQFLKKDKVRGVIYFLPFQLLFLHVQKNQILLLVWFVIIGFVTNALASAAGIQSLFLAPEYLGTVNEFAYFIVGLSLGGVIMAFNIASYVINSYRFPFLATLSKPFSKYCLNNFIIPFCVILIYNWNLYYFFRTYENLNLLSVLKYMSCFNGGIAFFMTLTLLYFHKFNKDFLKIFGFEAHERESQEGKKLKRVRFSILENRRIAIAEKRVKNTEEWIVGSYIRNFSSIKLARSSDHYDKKKLMMVFQQNHINAAFFSIFSVITLFILGAFRENPVFQLPAASSIMILGTVLLMISAAVHFFLRKWSTIFFIGVFLLSNQISKNPNFHSINYAYGLDYSKEVEYNPYKYQEELLASNDIANDIILHENILDKWKVKSITSANGKPKIIIVNASGGGSKLACWTFACLQYLDYQLEGKIMKNMHLMTGSSGGMIGASYWREIYYQSSIGNIESCYDQKWYDNIGKDLLNPIASSIALNDLFFRWQHFSEGNYRYLKDRGYAFEKKLNENTDYILDKRLYDYSDLEKNATIPLIIFSPSITNDAKRLIISPLPMSFMSNNLPLQNNRITTIENIEFSRLFKNNNPLNLKFTSAIRMNASFPYVMPLVSLPSSPNLEIIDAGMRDNYGTRTSIQYLYHLKKWINENTSGVILLRFYDGKKVDYTQQKSSSLIKDLFSPINGLAGNVSKIHMQENDNLIQVMSNQFSVPMHVIDFRLGQDDHKKDIAMSFHLTANERKQILMALENKGIQDNVVLLKKLLQ